MALAGKLKAFLREHQAEFTTPPHPKTCTSRNAAAPARAPAERDAEGVGDGDSFHLAPIPGQRRLRLRAAGEALGREVQLARDADHVPVDCTPGAVPPLVGRCGLQTLVDKARATMADLCIEAGDPRTLAHVTADRLRRLTRGARTGHFARAG
jgi:prolyl-tRNA editing enzyme YbaK/EbsC (Cys-tRNA(Pro) deacylase)